LVDLEMPGELSLVLVQPECIRVGADLFLDRSLSSH
jgi:hypothetical protein